MPDTIDIGDVTFDMDDMALPVGFTGGDTVYDGTLTIQQNGTTVGSFSANSSSNVTINLQGSGVSDVRVNGSSVVSNNIASVTVPTKTSDLTNDSGFLTAHQDISGKADKATTYTKTEVNTLLVSKANTSDLSSVATSGDYSDLTNTPPIPTDTSDLNNDSGFITNAVNDLTNYYLKSNTYTKSEIESLISAIKQFTYESVSVLPTASASTMNKIYLVPSAGSIVGNVKDEYITLVSGGTYSWEQIGSTSIDLSNYYTKTETNSLLSNKADNEDIPTHTSDLTNDSGFLTAHQDISGKADKSTTYTKTEVNSLISGFEQESNKVTVISSSSTDSQYPTAKAVFESELDIKEIAEGKSTSYVVSYADNPEFNSQLDTVQITGSFKDINGVTYSVEDLKLGDNIYVVETDVPDRWCSEPSANPSVGCNLHKLETAKVPVTDVKKNGTSVVVNGVADISVPTNTSDLYNDSGFLTAHQDISGKADKSTTYTKTEVNSLISGFEASSNKVTTITAQSTDAQYPTAKAVWDTEEDIKEIAEGKTRSYSVSIVNNPSFNTQNAQISITGTFTDINSVVHNVSDLKVGDNIYIIETDVPDRWIGNVSSNTATCYKLETAKVPVLDVTQNGVSVVSNGTAAITIPGVIDNLTSSSTTNPLSANQGRVLNTNKENVSNKVTSISSSSTNAQYPSAKCVYDIIGNLESLLEAML